jgi:hypothetical protein
MNGDMKRGRGRPAVYNSDAERKAARALKARERRAEQRTQGLKEVRRMVRANPEKLTSDTIDLSAIPLHRR